MPKEKKTSGETTPMIDKTDDNASNASNYSGVATERTYDLSTAGDKKMTVSTGEKYAPPTATPSETPTSTFTDVPSETTYGRRFANKLSNLRIMGQCYDRSKYKHAIVIPGNEEEGKKDRRIEPPRLDKGWQFFEHYILPRCYANREDSGKGRKYVRAPPGEEKENTRLYPVWNTPLEDMADFGIGVGLYFHMVRFFAIVALIAGFMSTPSILFYMHDYSPDGREGLENPLNMGTAICTSTSWQPCPDCKVSDLEVWPTKADNPRRVIEGLSPNGENDVAFITKNECDINETFSIMNLATMLFFCAATFLFIFLQRRERARLDEGEQTTSDYSIRVKNPPSNAKDPQKWKDFFEDAFENVHVTVCTVALDNEDLIKKLVKKRKLLLKLKNRLPAHIKFSSEDLEMTVLQCPEPGILSRLLCCSAGPKALYDKVQAIDQEIERYVGQVYPASSVYVTFETEEMQRRVLEEMTYPKLCKGFVDSKYLFDAHVLQIDEPDEPSSIRWHDLDEKKTVRIFQQICTFTATFALIFGGGVLIAMARDSSITLSAIVIIILNNLSPEAVRFLTSFESHVNETSYASSVYVKVTLFRWVNTAIITAIITPFMYTAQDGQHLIEGIRILFTAELVQRPLVQLTDWQGNLQRHLFAPRSKDQRRMNLLFSSKEYSIGERYTDVTKLLFLTCFYATIYPAAWYFAAATLSVYYWVDKFCVLRTWKQGPKISGKISIYSVYYFLLCIVTYSVMSAYNIAGFPFDNACETGEYLPEYYEGTYGSEGNGINFTISADDKVYKFCNQNLFRFFPVVFPPFPSDQPVGSEWMSETQLKYLPIYGWLCLGIIITVSAIIAIRLFVRSVVPLCFRKYKSQGRAMEDTFSEVDDIKGYIPNVDIRGYEFPYLMCDISDIDPELIGWSANSTVDPNSYNLTSDLPQVLRRTKSKKTIGEENPVFSKVMHWPPSSETESFQNVDMPSRDDSMLGACFRFVFQ